MTGRTQVGIIGAGPGGLFLSHLLHRAGIESVVLEARSRHAVEATLRAGVLEHWVVRLMHELGLGARLAHAAHVHDGITLQWDRRRHHLDIAGLTGGKGVTVYPQHEVLKDLIAGHPGQAPAILFGARCRGIDGIEGERPVIAYDLEGAAATLACDFVVAADGFHGIGRQAIPARLRTEYQKTYPFGWLGILTRAPRSWHELIYANQADGFALLSTRTPEVQRMYLQCDPADDVGHWSDDRIWAGLHARLDVDDAWQLKEGPIFRKGIVPLRSFVCEPMQHGRLFLAGDAAHIVPPTGAKGLNLAVADVLVLSRAMEAFYRGGGPDLLRRYTGMALRRVWKAERFSWYMTTMLHRNGHETEFERRIHVADLDLVTTLEPQARALAENYVGLPFDT